MLPRYSNDNSTLLGYYSTKITPSHTLRTPSAGRNRCARH